MFKLNILGMNACNEYQYVTCSVMRVLSQSSRNLLANAVNFALYADLPNRFLCSKG